MARSAAESLAKPAADRAPAAGRAARDRDPERAPLSSPERVVAHITKGLLRREYSPGQRLVEADLTESLGVSRSTIREALKILAAQGVVEIIPHRGAMIRQLTLADAEHLLGVLEVLTGLAARLAALRIDEGRNRARFAAAAAPLTDGDDDDKLGRLQDERANFYQAMFDIAGNADLDRAMPTCRAHLLRNQFYPVLTRADVRAMVAEYRKIVEAILAGDADRAEQQTRRHLQKTRERILPHLR